MCSVYSLQAQTYPPKDTDTPQLEFALQLRVTLGETYSIQNTQHGRRTVIPITGGTFEWSQSFKGIVLNVWRVNRLYLFCRFFIWFPSRNRPPVRR